MTTYCNIYILKDTWLVLSFLLLREEEFLSIKIVFNPSFLKRFGFTILQGYLTYWAFTAETVEWKENIILKAQ